jgi:short-subunit dehydrogenase
VKKAVVTGGSKGIGRACVAAFLEHDFQVYTCARSAQGLELLLQEFSGKPLHIYKADMGDARQVKEFGQWVQIQAGAVDVLINNAGIFRPGQILNEDEDVFDELIQVNLASAYRLTRMLAPHMVARKLGHIFNICSTASITAYTNGGSYCISKFGLYGMSKVLREELKPTGVKVTAVLPGATFTSSWEGAGLPEDRFIPAEDIASAIWHTYSMAPSTVVEDIILRPQLGDIS